MHHNLDRFRARLHIDRILKMVKCLAAANPLLAAWVSVISIFCEKTAAVKGLGKLLNVLFNRNQSRAGAGDHFDKHAFNFFTQTGIVQIHTEDIHIG